MFLLIILITKGFRIPYKYIAIRERAPGFILVGDIYISKLNNLHVISRLSLKSDLKFINLYI